MDRLQKQPPKPDNQDNRSFLNEVSLRVTMLGRLMQSKAIGLVFSLMLPFLPAAMAQAFPAASEGESSRPFPTYSSDYLSPLPSRGEPATNLPPREIFVGKLVEVDRPVDGRTGFIPSQQTDDLEFVIPERWGESELENSPGRLRVPRLRHASHHPYVDYRRDESSFGFLPGSSDQLGWVDLDSTPFQASGYRSGFAAQLGFHWLSGPKTVDLPPRVYDLAFGYQRRDQLTEGLSYDVASSIGFFTDFEGSAREGLRFPGHAVGILHASPETDWVFGIDYLHRGDIKLLPVFGISRHSELHPNMRFDLVFPRPQVELAFQSGRTLYLAGRLGGGTWGVEMPTHEDDLMTYRDYRLLLGLKKASGAGESAIEAGYVFGRKVEFRSSGTEINPDDGFVLRFVSTR